MLLTFVVLIFVKCVFSELPLKLECAILGTKLIPGNYVLPDDYLYTVLLEYEKNGKSTGFHCGGALIHKKYILTAAHCVVGNIIDKYGQPYKVRFNEFNRGSNINPDYDTGPPIDLDIQEIIPHLKYNDSDLQQLNDIALIRIVGDKPGFVDPICFPYHQKIDFERQTTRSNRFSVVGWGITETNNGRDDKRHGFLETISNEDCAKHVNFLLEESQFCAIRRNTSYHDERADESCYGDTGGALLLDGFNVDYYISGIESMRYNNCDNKNIVVAPILYTNVTQFLPWIRDNLKP